MEGISTYPGSRKCTIAALCCSMALLSLVCLASKQFAKPAAQPAKTYPAHDEHPTEGVTVAIDPYDMADKAQIFSVSYRDRHARSEEHTSELQSRSDLVCRLLLEKKKITLHPH